MISQAVEEFKKVESKNQKFEEINSTTIPVVPRVTKSFRDWAAPAFADGRSSSK
jgi:hypothetical protein